MHSDEQALLAFASYHRRPIGRPERMCIHTMWQQMQTFRLDLSTEIRQLIRSDDDGRVKCGQVAVSRQALL